MYRKIEKYIKQYLLSDEKKILCLKGARQIGKTYIISKVIKECYKNCIEINFDEDFKGDQLFKNVKTTIDFYIQLSVKYGNMMNDATDTIVFLDEIQIYPQYFSMLKQLRQENRFRYICSGSLLGVELKNGAYGLTPMGSIIEKEMYPMDFEEFLIANGFGSEAIAHIKECYTERKSLEESLHKTVLNYFLTYLYVGGLPDAVQTYVNEKNVYKIKEIQKDIINFYKQDASKYDQENKLKIERVYDSILSTIDNKVKRLQFSDIEDIKNARFTKYQYEFEYLTHSGIAIECTAISEPKFPLVQSSQKNLIKLYFNDVGLLSYFLYQTNINAILQERTGVNLGSVYETVVAQELKAHNHNIYYYDRRKIGEVDYLVDDYDNLCVLPIEVKSSKEGYTYRAMPKLLNVENYNMKQGIVLSNDREVTIKDKIIHMPIYYVMFI